ncbi:MAG: hypothetical protein GY786_06750, partial [Proteobacteria bacterium]|nr:hypothetical protein [Pseudomonadota bacterium]
TETDGFTPVTQLPDENDYNAESVQPALAGKGNPQPGNRDVMGDLFNLKDSPADELLDAIHLMDVHGSNPDQAAQMLDRMEDDGNVGVTKFTPERIDNEPISEIGDRLDEFFSLEDTPTSSQGNEAESEQVGNDNSQTIEIEHDDDGIVPFDFEEDDHSEDISSASDNQKESQDIDLTILNRLKANITSSHWLTEESSFLSIKNDISLLEKRSASELQNQQLFEVVNSILDAALSQSKPDQNNSDRTGQENGKPTQSEKTQKDKSSDTTPEIKTENNRV